MRFKITEDNPLTYHHIKKKEHGGKWSVDNGAPLTQEAQSYLHYIEKKDVRTYNEINKVLKEINTQGFGPTEKQQKKIELLMIRFEVTHIIQLQNHKNQKKGLVNPIAARKRRQKGQKTKKIQKSPKKVLIFQCFFSILLYVWRARMCEVADTPG